MWVLLEQDKTIRHGHKTFFKGWSEGEPCTTRDLNEAHKFKDKTEAKLSMAYRFRGSSFVPVEVELAVKSKAAA